jgi:hypothetical protein
MSIQGNIENNLDKNFENFNYLPKKILLEDIDMGLFQAVKGFNLSMLNERNRNRQVPLVWATQELWAERKINFPVLENENASEMGRPFMVLYRTSVKDGTSPNKYTIPNNKKFKYLKVPIFDGTVKGMDIYKVPQPIYVDLEYELVFETHFQQQANAFYELIQYQSSNRQFYINVNGYDIPVIFDDASENNTIEINSETIFQVIFPVKILGKLVDPTKFEKVQTITKVAINISEKK